MTRWLIVFVMVFAGCVASLPDDDGVTADLACETARLTLEARRRIQPTPTPASDACDNCNGTGKIGDGRIVMPCPICKGTGKKPKAAAAVCTTGTCR